MVLEESGAFTVCGEAGTISAARQLVEALQPDFIVLDLVMGGRDGTELVEDLLAIHSAARILAYSSIDEKSHALRTVRAGARGYVMKSQKLDDIVAALETMARGVVSKPSLEEREEFHRRITAINLQRIWWMTLTSVNLSGAIFAWNILYVRQNPMAGTE